MLDEVERWLEQPVVGGGRPTAGRCCSRPSGRRAARGTRERRAARAGRGGGRSARSSTAIRRELMARRGAAGRRAGRGRLRLHATVRRRWRRRRAPGWCAGTRSCRGCRPCRARARCCGGRCWSTSGEIVCFVDADLREFDAPSSCRGSSGRCSPSPDVQLVKAMYDRPLGTGGGRSCRPAAGGSPSWSPGRCSTCTGRGWRASSSRSAASTRRAAPCSNGCRSRSATAWSWACWSTRSGWSGWTRSPRWTWGCGTTGTRTARRSAGWPRRSTAPRSCGSSRGHGTWCGPGLTQFDRGEAAASCPAPTRSTRRNGRRCGTSRSTCGGGRRERATARLRVRTRWRGRASWPGDTA